MKLSVELQQPAKGPTVSAKYPEHDKLHAIRDKSQVCGEFFDWLSEHGWTLCETHDHSGCERDKEGFGWDCGLERGSYVPVRVPLLDLLSEFFAIDRDKIEEEKCRMLAEIRNAQ